MQSQKDILLFDGVCNLCSNAVQFVIKRDKKDQFKFAPLQSEEGKILLEKRGYSSKSLSSFVLIRGKKVYDMSSASLEVCRSLGGFWKIFYAFIIIPKSFRDFIYKLIATNRYKWFGKSNACMVPTPELKSKFL